MKRLGIRDMRSADLRGVGGLGIHASKPEGDPSSFACFMMEVGPLTDLVTICHDANNVKAVRNIRGFGLWGNMG